jgi:hypothetical protein
MNVPQVATQLDKILKASIEFIDCSEVTSVDQAAGKGANHPCTESNVGRLFRDAVVSPGGEFTVCWQSDYTASKSQTPADAKQAKKLYLQRQQQFMDLKVCPSIVLCSAPNQVLRGISRWLPSSSYSVLMSAWPNPAQAQKHLKVLRNKLCCENLSMFCIPMAAPHLLRAFHLHSATSATLGRHACRLSRLQQWQCQGSRWQHMQRLLHGLHQRECDLSASKKI